MNHPRKPIPRRGGAKARVREHMRATGGTYQQALQTLRGGVTPPAAEVPRLYLGRELDPVTFEANGEDCWWPLSGEDRCMMIAGEGADLRYLAYAWQLLERGCRVLVITTHGSVWRTAWGDRAEVYELTDDDTVRDATDALKGFQNLDPVWGSVGGAVIVDLTRADLNARVEDSWQWEQLWLWLTLLPERAASDGMVVLTASSHLPEFDYSAYPARMSTNVRTDHDGWPQVGKRDPWMSMFPGWERCLRRASDAQAEAAHPVWHGMNPKVGRVALVNLPGEPTRLILGTDPPLGSMPPEWWSKSWRFAAGAMPEGVPDAAAGAPDHPGDRLFRPGGPVEADPEVFGVWPTEDVRDGEMW